MSRILVVDDERSMREMLAIGLRSDIEDCEVTTAADGDSAQAALREGPVDVVVSDIRMPGLDGIELLKVVKELSPDTEVILITAYASTESAIEALRLGAYDYVTKPFDVEELKVTVRHALEDLEPPGDEVPQREDLEDRRRLDQLVGRSPEMQRVFDFIERVADSETTVLIIGESGTGKELVARAIHVNGPRGDAPFVTVNCAALPPQLLESELFGHVKGAFTGADRDKEGLFEAADGGTLLLDEIGDMPLSMQPKLLRVLEDHEVRRVGSTEQTAVDVRVIAATNKDLQSAVEAGEFREDLFYRINVIQIELPPLRERKDDIPLLVDHFLERYAADAGKEIASISPEAEEMLQAYRWPGNVRELVNAVRHAVTLETEDTVRPENLPFSIARDVGAATGRRRARGEATDDAAGDGAGVAPGETSGAAGGEAVHVTELPESGLDLESRLDEIKRQYMLQALEECGGVQKKAAELLGMSFRSFRYYLEKFDLRDRID